MANKICDIRPVDLNMVNEVSFIYFNKLIKILNTHAKDIIINIFSPVN